LYEGITLKPVEIILSGGERMRENDGDEPTPSTLKVYVEMSQ
jgi:hypothetical protein